jgi:hypothetical protein
LRFVNLTDNPRFIEEVSDATEHSGGGSKHSKDTKSLGGCGGRMQDHQGSELRDPIGRKGQQ